MNDTDKMKPMMFIPPDTVSDEDVKLLRENGICVVIAKEPAALKFVDPMPAASSRTQIERAAISLSRKLLNKSSCPWDDQMRGVFSRMYIELLVEGTPLDARPSKQEQEEDYYRQEKYLEIQRIARADAKAERDAKKAKVKETK